MANNIRGPGALAYLGVNATNPSNTRVLKRAPTATDTKNVSIGDFWLDSNAEILYQLVNLENDTATWNVVISSNASGAKIDTSGQIFLDSSASNVQAIRLRASDPASGITFQSGAAGITAGTTGDIILQSSFDVANAIEINAVGDDGGIVLLSGNNTGPINRQGVFLSNGVDTAQIIIGTGSPNTVVTAFQGSLFIRTDGAAATTLYVNTDGAMAWSALT